MKRAVLAIRVPAVPSVGHGDVNPRRRLRAHLAQWTVTRPFTRGVRFIVADPEGQALARYTDGELERKWRHPTFGRRDKSGDWVTRSQSPWFFVNIRRHEDGFQGAVSRSIDAMIDRLGA